MRHPLDVRDIGRVSYDKCLELQRKLVEERKEGTIRDTLLLVEHDSVFTLGRRKTSPGNVVDAGDIPVVEVERGGDVTWHGPGQIVAYPIFRLREDERDLHKVLRKLEDALIRVLAVVGLEGGRRENHTGVWCQGKKLVSVGVAVKGWVTYHGIALNVDCDLGVFERINPCGLDAEVMSSLTELGATRLPPEELRALVAMEIARSFGRRFPRGV
jgi:lipoyl(octanoyl) transferase